MTNNEWKKLHLELPLHTRLVYWAQNEDMIDQYYTMRGADLMDAADRIEKLEKALRVAAGYISTFPPHTGWHPEDVYNWILMKLETE